MKALVAQLEFISKFFIWMAFCMQPLPSTSSTIDSLNSDGFSVGNFHLILQYHGELMEID